MMKSKTNCFLGKQLRGDDAPLASQINSWLDSHPGWDVVEGSEYEDDEYDDEGDDDGSKDAGYYFFVSVNALVG